MGRHIRHNRRDRPADYQAKFDMHMGRPVRGMTAALVGIIQHEQVKEGQVNSLPGII
jgi:hypothetical protein